MYAPQIAGQPSPESGATGRKMSRPKLGALVLLLTLGVGGGGVALWWKLRPAEPEETPQNEKSFEDIKRAEMEDWMRDLGYVD